LGVILQKVVLYYKKKNMKYCVKLLKKLFLDILQMFHAEYKQLDGFYSGAGWSTQING